MDRLVFLLTSFGLAEIKFERFLRGTSSIQMAIIYFARVKCATGIHDTWRAKSHSCVVDSGQSASKLVPTGLN